jgi:hypothetical protein
MRSAAALAKVVLFAGLSLLFVAMVAHAEFKPISPFAATEVAPGPPSAFVPPTAAPFQAPGALGRSSLGCSTSSRACNGRSP